MDVQPGTSKELGVWELTPRTNIVGAVRVGHLDLVVNPKAPFTSVLFMLGYARNPSFPVTEFEGVEADLWPVLAETLARLAERALSHGALQGYVTRDEAASVLRGRIRASDQMSRRFGLPFPLEITYDDYDVDIAENKILRSALHQMSLAPGLPRERYGRLAHLSRRLEGASFLVPGVPVPSWHLTRLNARYHDALMLAELILDSRGLDVSAGSRPVASFVVNMANAFEGFVEAALGEALSQEPGELRAQYADALDVGGWIVIRPDTVFLRGGKVKAVFDAKYKLASPTGAYPNADQYQMLAYCTALSLSRGYLIYAGTKVDIVEPSNSRVRNTEVDLVQWPLDVSVAPADLIEQVRNVAQHAVQRLERVSTPLGVG